MMISVSEFHFLHIKVTVGDIRVGGGFCTALPLENTGAFGVHFKVGIASCRTGEGSQTSSKWSRGGVFGHV